MNKQASELQPPPLPDLKVPQSDGTTLDVTGNNEDPSVISKQWPQPRLWVQVSGVDSAGNELVINLHENVEATQEQLANGLNELVSIDELKKFKNESIISFDAKITSNGDADVSTARSFPTKKVLIQTLADLNETTTFNDRTFGGWTPGNGGKLLELFRRSDTDYCLHNPLSGPGENHGIVLQKTFPAVPGRKYEFSLSTMKGYEPGEHGAMITLSIDNNISPLYSAAGANWKTFKFSATATSETIVVALNVADAIGPGKRFYAEDFNVKVLRRT